MTSQGRFPLRWFSLAAALAAARQACSALADPDLWWQLRAGQLILERHAIPGSDPFSFTAHGARWTNHEWLTEVFLAVAFALGGGAGLTVLRIGLLALATALLGWLLWRRARQPFLAAVLVAFYLPALAGFLNVRAHAFTYVLTLAALALLEIGRQRPRVLYLLPPLLALWANLHGGFVVGWGTVIVSLTLSAAGWGREGAAVRPRLAATVIGLSLAAPLLNPRGFELFVYLVRELGAEHATVSEWKSVRELPSLLPVFLAAAGPPLVLLAASVRRARSADAVLLVVSVALAYRHLRFLPLVWIFGSLVVAQALGLQGQPRLARREAWQRALARPLAWGLLCALLAMTGLPRLFAELRRKGLGLEVNRRSVPVLAVRVLRDLDLGPNLMTRLDWGGYAIYHLWPRYLVSIDGRNVTVYPESFVASQIAAYDSGDPLVGLTGRRVDVALVESRGPGFDGMARRADWQLVFRDPLSAIFVPKARIAELQRRGSPPPESYALEEPLLLFP